MIYKILHKIFGWDYVHWSSGAYSGIARVRVDGNGNPFIFRFGKQDVLKLYNPPYNTVNIITWLTCSSNKYIMSHETPKN